MSGVFALTWAFSGLLSMEPFAWTNAPELRIPADAMAGGATWSWSAYEGMDSTALQALVAPRFRSRKIGLRRIHR